MPALSSYRDLINLSPPAVAQHSAPSSTAAAAAQLDGLAYLYAEHHGPDAYHPTPHELSHQPASRRDQLLRDLLTIRDASRGPLPAEVLQAVELWLASKSRNSPDPVVPVEEVKNIASELFPQLAEDELPAELGRVAFWRGDITRLASPQLAIVNPANTRMLGCFQPSHLCADNVIHAAAGPRLRADCYSVMQAEGKEDLDVAEPIVTRGGALPAGYVLHVAGPKLERGQAPTDEEREQLESAYENCLALAAETGTIDTVAFPCISTGLFAYPAGSAALVALSTTLRWLASHPSTPLRVIFVLFSASDATHYLAALSSLYASLPTPRALVKHFALPEHVQRWVEEADSVIIHAGAGLSADAVKEELGLGLDYNSKELFKKLYPGLVESTPLRALYHTIGYEFEDPLVHWAFFLSHPRNVLSWGQTPVYQRLHQLANTRSSDPLYTILTSNVDHLFHQSGFDVDRIHTPQGSYAIFQCLTPCHPDAFFNAQPWFERAAPHIQPQTMRLPEELAAELIPRCQRCGGEVFLNVRGGDWFLESPQRGQRERYEAQVAEQVERARERGGKVLLLEVGAGFNTPSVVRWPGEELCRKSGGVVRLVRVNLAHPEVPVDLKEAGWAEGVRMGGLDFVTTVLEGK